MGAGAAAGVVAAAEGAAGVAGVAGELAVAGADGEEIPVVGVVPAPGDTPAHPVTPTASARVRKRVPMDREFSHVPMFTT
jgi:hypothetical protein